MHVLSRRITLVLSEQNSSYTRSNSKSIDMFSVRDISFYFNAPLKRTCVPTSQITITLEQHLNELASRAKRFNPRIFFFSYKARQI